MSEAIVAYDGFEDISNLEVYLDLRDKENAGPDEALLAQIAENEICTPLIVCPSKKDGKYAIIDGRRRYEAAKKLGIQRVPTVCWNIDSRSEAILMALNTDTRNSFNPMEVARAYMELKKEGLDEEVIATKMGVSERKVVEALKVLEGASEKVKSSNLAHRAKAQLAEMPKRKQDELLKELEGKGREAAGRAIREAKEKEGQKVRGRKPVDYQLPKDFKLRVQQLENRINRELKGEPASKRFRVIRDVVDYMKGIGDLEDLISGKKK